MLQAAIEEGVVVGGGCALLRLSTRVDGLKQLLDNEEQQVPLFVNSDQFFPWPFCSKLDNLNQCPE